MLQDGYFMSDKRVLIDFGSTFTKGVVFDLDKEEILTRVQTPSTVLTDVTIGLINAFELIEKNVPLTPDEISSTVACSSAAGGLRMVCVGLVPDYTTKAGHLAALGAGAKVVGLYSYELTSTELAEISELKPDILLLTGGTDGGNKKIIIHNAEQLATISDDINYLIVAGNKSAYDGINAAFSDANINMSFTKNIMPEFGILELDDVNALIRDVFINRITEAKGVAKVSNIIKEILMPTPSAVLEAAALLARGTKNETGIGELLLVDVGGATTDVDSIARGTPTRDGVHTIGMQEPYMKRTVEGDLGMYHNIDSLADLAKQELTPPDDDSSEKLESIEEFQAIVNDLKEMLSVPGSSSQVQHHLMLSRIAVKTAVERHSGRIDAHWTHDGDVLVQQGKDLSEIKTIIGTGGPLAFSTDPKFILEGAKATPEKPNILNPINPDFLLDEEYILFAIGLLSQSEPDKALKIAKKYLKLL